MLCVIPGLPKNANIPAPNGLPMWTFYPLWTFCCCCNNSATLTILTSPIHLHTSISSLLNAQLSNHSVTTPMSLKGERFNRSLRSNFWHGSERVGGIWTNIDKVFWSAWTSCAEWPVSVPCDSKHWVHDLSSCSPEITAVTKDNLIHCMWHQISWQNRIYQKLWDQTLFHYSPEDMLLK